MSEDVEYFAGVKERNFLPARSEDKALKAIDRIFCWLARKHDKSGRFGQRLCRAFWKVAGRAYQRRSRDLANNPPWTYPDKKP